MRMLLASLLALAVQTLVSSPARAFPIPFTIDVSFPFEPSDVQGAIGGSFQNAGSFRVESSLLPTRGNALISFGQISDFSLRLPDFAVDAQHLSDGTCLSAAQLPVCGFLFSDGRIQGLVGQYAAPTSDPLFSFRLDNTSPNLFDPAPIFQAVSIESLAAGGTVASGFVSVRPVPEPVSSLLFGAGAGLVAMALRRSAPRLDRPLS